MGLLTLGVLAAQGYYRYRFLDQVIRIFEEKPLFIVPRGSPVDGAEDVSFETDCGYTLRGCYLRASAPRRGVVLFGPEFGSDRWSCYQYCSRLLEAGFDVFAFESRNQGESQTEASYDPMQWVTDRDLADMRAAVRYLKHRPDAPTEGIGLFGVSKGGSTGLLLAAEDPWVKCVATDGAYATYSTMVPYMRRWVSIYVKTAENIRRRIVPDWFYGWIGLAAMDRVSARRGVRFLSVERAADKLRQPVLMIHGQADAYIKPEMAAKLFDRLAATDKQLWLVDGAKHNQALNVAEAEYTRRLVEFFTGHLDRTSTVVTKPLQAGSHSELATAK
jgi:pimeloyl-ACP methyl ester carboxylesterase